MIKSINNLKNNHEQTKHQAQAMLIMFTCIDNFN